MDAFRDVDFSEDELAYLNSGGQAPLPDEPEPVATEAEPVAEGAPEPEAEPAAADTDPEVIEEGDETHKGRKVGYSAYLRKKAEAEAARNEREELRTQLEASKREQAVQNARIEERFKLWQQSQQHAAQQAATKTPEPVAPPDREADPLAYIAWQDERLNRIEQHTAQSAEQTRQTQLISQLDQAYRADNFQAKQEVPEYPEAYNYLVQCEQQRIRIQNPHFTQQQINAAIEQGERQLAAAAFQRGQRPAAMILQMAATYGWAPRAAAAQEPAQPDPAAEQAKIDAAARGQVQNRTLSTAGRPGGSTAMTLERFMAMSDDDARDWTAKNPDGLARLGGGR